MDSLIEFRRRVMSLLGASAADDKSGPDKKKVKELKDLLAQMVDAIEAVDAKKGELEKAKNERAKALEKYSKILDPLKAYKSELQSEFMALRDKHAARLGDFISQLKALGDKGRVATEMVKAIEKPVDQEANPILIDDLLGAVSGNVKKVGDLAYKVEALVGEWLETGAWKPEVKAHVEKVLKHELLDAKKEAERRKKEAEAEVKELSRQEETRESLDLIKQFKAAAEDAAAEAAAAEDAMADLEKGVDASLSVSAEDGMPSDSIFQAIFDKADSKLAEAEEALAELSQIVDEISSAMPQAPAAPAEPAPEPMPEDVPAEEPMPEPELEMASSSLDRAADDANPVMGPEPLPDTTKNQEKVQRKVDEIQGKAVEVLKEFDSNKAQLHLVNKMIKELNANPEIQEAVKKTKESGEAYAQAFQKLKDLEGQATELMKELDMQSAELPNKIRVWIEERKNKGLSESEVEEFQQDAERFQAWAQKFLASDENAKLAEILESLTKSKEAVEEIHDATISIKDKPSYPPGTTKLVKKRIQDFKEKDKKKRQQPEEQGDPEASMEDAITVEADEIGSLIDQWVAGLEEAVSKMEELVKSSGENAGELSEIIPGAAAAASADDAWTRSADYKQYPSEHDLSGGAWELVEADGRKELVIDKDLKSRITKKLRDMHKGAFRPGQRVALDMGGTIVEASVKQYVGEGKYDVEAHGCVYRAPAEAIFASHEDIWR